MNRFLNNIFFKSFIFVTTINLNYASLIEHNVSLVSIVFQFIVGLVYFQFFFKDTFKNVQVNKFENPLFKLAIFITLLLVTNFELITGNSPFSLILLLTQIAYCIILSHIIVPSWHKKMITQNQL